MSATLTTSWYEERRTCSASKAGQSTVRGETNRIKSYLRRGRGGLSSYQAYQRRVPVWCSAPLAQGSGKRHTWTLPRSNQSDSAVPHGMNARNAWGPRISDMKEKKTHGCKAMTARPVSLWLIILFASNGGKERDKMAKECGFSFICLSKLSQIRGNQSINRASIPLLRSNNRSSSMRFSSTGPSRRYVAVRSPWTDRAHR